MARSMADAELTELTWQRFGNHIKVTYSTGERVYLGPGDLGRAAQLAQDAGLIRVPTNDQMARWAREADGPEANGSASM
jgi:hypothetical protein